VLADAGRQLKRLEEETETAEERWLELSDLIEGIEKEAQQA
jgi:hypothetical protein